MRSPVVVSSTSSPADADLIASYLRSQGIEAAARTHLDRSAYAGLGGATVLVPQEQRLEAELELMMLEESARQHRAENPDSTTVPGIRPVRTWIRVASYLVLCAMVVMSVVPSIAIIWGRVLG